MSSLQERITDIEERLGRGAERMTSIEAKLDVNNKATAEVLEIVKMARGFFKVLGVIGICIKWLGGIAAAVAAIWAVIYAVLHDGKMP